MYVGHLEINRLGLGRSLRPHDAAPFAQILYLFGVRDLAHHQVQGLQ